MLSIYRLLQHAQDPGVVETACTALCNALLCDEARVRLGTLGGRPLTVVASAIAPHYGDVALIDQATLALRAILLHGRAGPADAAGVVPVFLELLKTFADSASRCAAVSFVCAPTLQRCSTPPHVRVSFRCAASWSSSCRSPPALTRS